MLLTISYFRHSFITCRLRRLKKKRGNAWGTPHTPANGCRPLHSYLLLLLNGRGQFKGGRRLAPAFGGLCFEASDGFIGHIATAQGGWVNARAVKVAAAGGDEMVFVRQGAQRLFLLPGVRAIVGFESYHAGFA